MLLGSGLFLSTISRTQQQTMMSAFFFFLPAFMLSGFSFPIRNLKGTGVEILWPQLAAMGLIGVTILLVSAARFRKRLD